jgi:uncharacterized protein DUF4231
MGMAHDLDQMFQEHLSYYDKHATSNYRAYTALKLVEIVAASSIPVISLAGRSRIPAAVLGALIAVVEGYLNLGKLHERWIGFRKAAENLRVEGLMWRTGSGRYGDSTKRDQVFAEQLGSILQQERSEWLSVFGRAGRPADE